MPIIPGAGVVGGGGISISIKKYYFNVSIPKKYPHIGLIHKERNEHWSLG